MSTRGASGTASVAGCRGFGRVGVAEGAVAVGATGAEPSAAITALAGSSTGCSGRREHDEPNEDHDEAERCCEDEILVLIVHCRRPPCHGMTVGVVQQRCAPKVKGVVRPILPSSVELTRIRSVHPDFRPISGGILQFGLVFLHPSERLGQRAWDGRCQSPGRGGIPIVRAWRVRRRFRRLRTGFQDPAARPW